MKLKSNDGFYPSLPGRTLELGDYGYFDGSQWCRMGNIERISGFPIYLHVNEHKDCQNIYILKDGHLKVDVAQKTGTAQNADKSLISFSKDSGFYINGQVRLKKEYDSVGIEVKDFLCILEKNGIWKKNYFLVVAVAYSDSFITFLSKAKGAELELQANLSQGAPLKKLETGLKGEYKQNNVEIVNHIEGDSIDSMGGWFVKLNRTSFGKDREIKYRTDDIDLD